jgi:hypothetical protein
MTATDGAAARPVERWASSTWVGAKVGAWPQREDHGGNRADSLKPRCNIGTETAAHGAILPAQNEG